MVDFVLLKKEIKNKEDDVGFFGAIMFLILCKLYRDN